MASGRIILPIAEPILNAAGEPDSGATLSIYTGGATSGTLANLYSDSGLGTPIANPQTSDSAGRFYDQTTVIWADSSMAYGCVVHLSDGSTLTYPNIYVLGASTNVSGFAPINSPNFTGVPTAPTPATNDNSTKLATTAFVQAQGYAPLNSPGLTGVPTAPTAAVGTNTTQLATTAFVLANSIVAGSVGTSGYIQLGNGLYMQWGQFTATITSTGSVTFPVAFPNACFACVPVPGGSNNPRSIFYVSAISASSFNWAYAAEGGSSASYTSYYIAMGH